jgi:hypothetical protein
MRCQSRQESASRGVSRAAAAALTGALLMTILGCKGGPGAGSGGGGAGGEDSTGGSGGGRTGGAPGAGGGQGSGGQGGSGQGGGAAASGGQGGGAGGSGGAKPGPDAGDASSSSGGSGGRADAGGTTPRSDSAVAEPDPSCIPSKLYGRTGELWKPDGRLIFAGYAGYHTGKGPIPDVAGPGKSVTEFGAKGDDEGDDTAAFLAAIEATEGVLLVPAGRYVITKQLIIKKSNFVFRGEGQGKTTLYFPRPLSEVGPPGTSWSFNGGFLFVNGADNGPVIGNVTANAGRGAQKLQVSATTGVKVGDWVRIVQTDKGGSLFRALYGGMHPGNVSEDGGTEVFHFYSKVTAVDAGSVTLERTLPFEVDTNWTPQLRAVMPTVRETGIEHLTLEMAAVRYPGHFMERGYNGIYYVGAMDSWVKDVRLVNAELGISIYRSYFVTVTDVILDASVDEPLVGHHGLNSARGADCWFTRFELKKKYVHDLTVDGYAMGTVFSQGKGLDMNMDHHGRAPYGTLWTNLDLGRGSRAFDNGGAGNRLPPTASYTTVWNLTATGNIELPPSDYGPYMNHIASGKGSAPGHWSVEDIPGNKLCQQDLHEDMLARRR